MRICTSRLSMDQSSVKKLVSCLGYPRGMLAKGQCDATCWCSSTPTEACSSKDKGRLSKTFTEADPVLGWLGWRTSPCFLWEGWGPHSSLPWSCCADRQRSLSFDGGWDCCKQCGGTDEAPSRLAETSAGSFWCTWTKMPWPWGEAVCVSRAGDSNFFQTCWLSCRHSS